jgi:CBS domain-containing protein
VIDGGKLVGIVTSSDYLREFSYGELAISRESIATHLRQTTDTIDADAAIEQASQQMEGSQRPHLAVLQGGCPIGLVSLADLGRSRLSQPSSASRQTVSSIMRRTPPLRPGQRLSEAAGLMVEHHLPAVVVTNQANRFLGILADSDILTLMLKQLK